MTASLDTFADPQVEALLALLVPALNEELKTDDGKLAVQKAYGWPVDRSRLVDSDLPLLLVYRTSSTTVWRTTMRKEHRVVFTFEYVHGPIALDLAAKRWPLLHATWAKLEQIISDGHHPAYASNALVLKAAGFVDKMQTPAPTVVFETPARDSDIRPAWRATMTLAHRDVVDRSTLQDFLSLDVQFRLVGGDDTLTEENVDASDPPVDGTSEQANPLVRQILTPP